MTPQYLGASVRRRYDKATNAELPLQALRALEELADHLDEWRWHLWDCAREKGASFTDIAAVYGLTRQAARERYVSRGR